MASTVTEDAGKYVKMFDIDPGLFTVGLDLVVKGDSPLKEYFVPHATYPGATIYIQVTTPPKAKIVLLRIDQVKHVDPVMTAEISSYRKISYLGHDIRLHPTYTQYGAESKKGGKTNFVFIVKVLIVKGRGAITYTY